MPRIIMAVTQTSNSFGPLMSDAEEPDHPVTGHCASTAFGPDTGYDYDFKLALSRKQRKIRAGKALQPAEWDPKP